MKRYNVTLSNYSCIFDSREGIETAAEAVEFAMGRGSHYRVYVDAGDAFDEVRAECYSETNVFHVQVGMEHCRHMTAAQFASYIERVL